MAPLELEDYRHGLVQDALSLGEADGRYAEDVFFELFCDQIIDAGELDTADRAHLSRRGIRVDGYGGDPSSAGGVLSLIALDFSQAPVMGTLTATGMDGAFKRTVNFVSKSLDPAFRDGLEETTPAFGLADLIATRWRNIDKIRLLLLSDQLLSSRVDGLQGGDINGVPVTYSVWDIGRLHRYASSSYGREDILIDLEKEFGAGLKALSAHPDGADYESYLIVIPGSQLAAIYDRWGARLLEQNVRVFLQARGNVNKGIRNTLDNEPDMFLAYNNGITATAEGIESRHSKGGLVITQFKNLQIVNGGQTTASIHVASRKKDADLSRVFVQMKLSIIGPEKAVEVVPKISQYANTQNRVNAADFFANHPFHVRMEEFSRRIFAPSPDGSFRESKWFYERARGQYQDAKASLSGAQKRKFDLEYPRRQVFSKTDLAKFLMVWRGNPDTVSKGAQKNFAEFARTIGVEWAKKDEVFNEDFYRHVIAKAIIFRATEKLVSAQPWYDGGYRANVVAYAIAKLANDVAERGRIVDFGAVWKLQAVPGALAESLVATAEAVHDVIVAPPPGIRNISEWAKKQACWSRVQRLEVGWPTDLDGALITAADAKGDERAAVKAQKVLSGIQAQTLVVTAGADLWKDVKAWGVSRSLLSETEQSIIQTAASMPRKLPTEKQSAVILEVLKRLQGDGCQIGRGLF